MSHGWRAPGPVRALVLHPWMRRGGDGPSRDPEARLDEAVGLAAAIDLEIVGAETVALATPKPATLIGGGKVDEIAARVAAEGIDLVIVDQALSPIQQRNLERAWNAKALDRTALILEIFGARARTREGRIQVELAHLTWAKSRLVRSWTHLERQRGGFGFLGGPGETQIEADRRVIGERIVKLERDLEKVRATRALHRKDRRRTPYPIVALAGYTNAGKSTLFNRLTDAKVAAEDKLFATLDPTMRRLETPAGRAIILSDTVGFISELPTELVAAFRATLEEVVEADIVLHVRDMASAERGSQAADVAAVLGDLGVGAEDGRTVIEVWNKTDLLGEEGRAELANLTARRDDAVAVSALTGEGARALLIRIDETLAARGRTLEFLLAPEAGAALAWLHRVGAVVSREDGEEGVRVSARLDDKDLGQFRKRFAAHIRTASHDLGPGL